MQGKVPVGVTSVAGYTATLAAVVAAVLAFLKGDRSEQTLGVLAAGGMAVLAFLSTQLGRYAQAHAAVKHAPLWPADSSGDVEQADWRDEPTTGTSDPGDGYEPGEPDIGAINARGEAVYFDAPHDLVDEPQDDGSDQVPEHERRDIHEVC